MVAARKRCDGGGRGQRKAPGGPLKRKILKNRRSGGEEIKRGNTSHYAGDPGGRKGNPEEVDGKCEFMGMRKRKYIIH